MSRPLHAVDTAVGILPMRIRSIRRNTSVTLSLRFPPSRSLPRFGISGFEGWEADLSVREMSCSTEPGNPEIAARTFVSGFPERLDTQLHGPHP